MILLTSMGMLRDRGSARVFRAAADRAAAAGRHDLSARSRARTAAVARASGISTDSLPCAFVNRTRRAGRASTSRWPCNWRAISGVTAEFVPVDRTISTTASIRRSATSSCPGAAITADRSARMQFSPSYLDETRRVHRPRPSRRSAFQSGRASARWAACALGVPRAPTYVQKIRDELAGRRDRSASIDMDDIFAADPPGRRRRRDGRARLGVRCSTRHYPVAVPKPRPFRCRWRTSIAGRDSARDGDGQYVDRAEAEGRHGGRAVRATGFWDEDSASDMRAMVRPARRAALVTLTTGSRYFGTSTESTWICGARRAPVGSVVRNADSSPVWHPMCATGRLWWPW